MNLTSCLRSVVVLASSSALASVASANVLVVATSGAPYTSIQAAVDAAVDGDTILVKRGSYSAGFVVDDKALSIVAEPEGSVAVWAPVTFRNLSATKRASLSGFRLHDGLDAWNCTGSLRFEAIAAISLGNNPPAWSADLHGCQDVAILRSELRGNDDPSSSVSNGGGLQVVDSRVALYDCQVFGGDGLQGFWLGPFSPYSPTSGHFACSVVGVTMLFASGSRFEGGAGGMGIPANCIPQPTPGGSGANGGGGIWFTVPESHVYVFDSIVMGGPGGAPGGGDVSCGAPPGTQSGTPGASTGGSGGPPQVMPGQSRRLHAPTLAREWVPMALTFTGQPGDSVWMEAGQQTHWALSAAFSGVRLVGLGSRRIFLGTLPASGTLTRTITFPDLGPGVESRTWQMQALFVDSANTSFLGSAQVAVVLDSAF